MTKTYTDDESIQRFQEKATKDIEIERNRAYLFALVSLGLAITAVIALIAITPLKTVEPLIVTVDSATARVLKVQVATPDVITANDSVIQSELAKYIMVRETIDPEDRQRLVDLTRLHTTQSAIDEYDHAMASENKANPYYEVGIGKRTVQVIAVTPLESGKGQVSWKSITYTPGKPNKEEVFISTVKYVFTGKPMNLHDRWENPLGFGVVAYRKDLEMGRKS